MSQRSLVESLLLGMEELGDDFDVDNSNHDFSAEERRAWSVSSLLADELGSSALVKAMLAKGELGKMRLWVPAVLCSRNTSFAFVVHTIVYIY